jgi:hypothetical protein
VVKQKYFPFALLVVIIGGVLAYLYLFQSEEKRVKKQFRLASDWMAKDSGENAFIMLNKIKSMGGLFSEPCRIKAEAYSFTGSYTPEEISGYAAQGRSQFTTLSLKFFDLSIHFPQKGVAKAILTVTVTGKLTSGEYVDETHEVECLLKKIEKKWLFSDVELVEVLKK